MVGSTISQRPSVLIALCLEKFPVGYFGVTTGHTQYSQAIETMAFPLLVTICDGIDYLKVAPFGRSQVLVQRLSPLQLGTTQTFKSPVDSQNWTLVCL